MLQRWRWFCLLRGPSAGALTIGRAAGWWGGSRGSASPRSEDGIAFTPKPQPNHLAVRRAMSGWDAHKSSMGKKKNLIFLPLLRLVGKASAHIRTVIFLCNLGNERQWLCFFTHMVKNTVLKRTPSQSMHGEGETYEQLNVMRKAEQSCSTVWGKHYWPQIIGKRKQKEQEVVTVSGKEERGGGQANITEVSDGWAITGNRRAPQNRNEFARCIGDYQEPALWDCFLVWKEKVEL